MPMDKIGRMIIAGEKPDCNAESIYNGSIYCNITEELCSYERTKDNKCKIEEKYNAE